MSSDADDIQLSLLPAPRRRTTPAPAEREPAARQPIARVAVDTPLAHLDRFFDYRVPAELDAVAAPGCRVKVRFAGRLVDGFLIERADVSDHDRLAWLPTVVSPEPVLTREVLDLCRAVADRYAGTLSDVLRLAIPPRHARAEASLASGAASAVSPVSGGAADAWSLYPDAPQFVEALAAARPARAVWSAVPGVDPSRAAAHAAAATLRAGRGVVVCVPDGRDLARWDAMFTEVLGPGHHVTLSAAQKPAQRYRSFLAAARGDVRVVVGTRAAAFAPVHDLGLVVMWDDGDDLHAEPRAPYAHVREVLLMRARAAEAGVLIGAYARTAEAQALVESGWCQSLEVSAPERRERWARVRLTDGTESGAAPVRLPGSVVKAIRGARGAVLVQVPRRGYRTSLSCQRCREAARCSACHGPLLQASAAAPLTCRWCATQVVSWACSTCGGVSLRAPVVGHHRTAEEFGRTFPDRTIVTSGGDAVLDEIDDAGALVLATPGAEPVASSGYGLVVLLDSWLMVARDDMRVTEEATRRWFNALALAAPDGSAVAVGDVAALQSLVRADPVGAAVRELADRAAAHLPPIARLATVEGSTDVVAGVASRPWTPHTEILGPVAVDDDASRLVVRAPRAEAGALSALLRDLQAERSAAKLPHLRIQVDPVTL